MRSLSRSPVYQRRLLLKRIRHHCTRILWKTTNNDRRETQIIYLFDIHDVLLTLLTNQNSLKNAQAVDPLESKETDILDRRDSWCESIMKELICVIVEKPSVNRGGHLQQHPLYSLPQKLSFRSFPKDPPRDLLSYQQLC